LLECDLYASKNLTNKGSHSKKKKKKKSSVHAVMKITVIQQKAGQC